MITTHSKDPRYLIEFSDGKHRALADVGPVKGGQGAGFGPHELMEASLATCINMWIRMQADKLGIPVGPISVIVTLKREHPEQAVFEYSVTLEDPLPLEHRVILLRVADECPVRKTLLKSLSFQRI